MPFGLTTDTINQITSIFNQYPTIEKVLLYGSRAKGNYKPGSDIDLSIVSANFSTKTLLEVQNKLEDLDLPYKIDLSHFESLTNPEFIDHINRIGIPFQIPK